jgi:hypothetical protein
MRYDTIRWYEGHDAKRAGLSFTACPYAKGTWESVNWKCGWLS